MRFSDEDVVAEPPAKKRCDPPVVASNSGPRDVQDDSDPDIIVEFMSSPLRKKARTLQYNFTNDVPKEKPQDTPCLKFCIKKDLATDTHQLHVKSDNPQKEEKTFGASFPGACVKQKLEARDDKKDVKDRKIGANDILSPKASLKSRHRCKNEPHKELCIKEESCIRDCFARMHLKSDSVEAVNPGFDGLLDSMFEEHNTLKVVDTFSTKTHAYPPPATFNMLLRTLLKQEDQLTKYNTFWYLQRVVDHYTPDKRSHQYYYDVLFSKDAFHWEEITQVIESSLRECDAYAARTSSDEGGANFLKLIVNILVRDFEASEQNDFLSVRVFHKQALVSLLLFKPETLSQRKLQSLLRYINVLVKPSCNKMQDNLLRILMQLLCIFSKTAQLMCSCSKSTVLSSFRLNYITKEITVHCRDVLGDKERSKIFLSMLSPAWLNIKVAESLLQRLIPGIPPNCWEVPTTLRKIVRQYIFPPNEEFLALKEKLLSSEIANDEHSSPLSLSHVMKPDHKGETLIHIQCRTGKLQALKESLSIPGIDINAEDNAGWTPLHECCNHGHLECARCLVTWFPPDEKHATVFTDHLNGANICASNDGTTPLHEAVMSNHVEVARLLLEYGGPSLLKMKDKDGNTPQDHARNAELMSMLQDAQQDTGWKRKQRFDHDNFCYDRDLSFSVRICPKFGDSVDSAYYACLLNILLKTYLYFSNVLPLRDFMETNSASGDVGSLVGKFLIQSEFTADTNYIVNCLDDMFVLQSLPEILRTLRRQISHADSSREVQGLLSSVEALLCFL